MATLSIHTGGQTGVDRAALDFALARGLSYGGWCPRGGWAEDFPVAPGLLAEYPRLTETPSDLPEQRTAWNVRDSHATLILVRGDELSRSPELWLSDGQPTWFSFDPAWSSTSCNPIRLIAPANG